MKGFKLSDFGKPKASLDHHSYQITEVANDGSFFMARRGDGNTTKFYSNTYGKLVKEGKVFDVNDDALTFKLKIDRNNEVETTSVDLSK